MRIEFDEAKNAANFDKHGYSLRVGAVVMDHLLGARKDERRIDGEARFNAFGLVEGRLFACTYTIRRRREDHIGTQGQSSGATGMAIVTVTPEMAAQAVAEIDWVAFDAQTDEEIERNVASDPDAPPILTDGETAAAMARTVRKRLGISQSEFAARFRIPVATLRDWEQNRRQPDGAAFAYLRVIAREPEMVARALAPA